MRTRNSFRRGTALLYAAVAFTTVVAIVSLAVDFGRYVVARNELQTAADAAARYAATGLVNSLSGTNAAPYNAAAAALQNKVDGTPVVCDPATDVEVGKWNKTARVFTVSSNSPNAVRVTLQRTKARGNPIRLVFASILGKESADIVAQSTAMIDYGTSAKTYSYAVPATSNVWLAGMPAGTVSNPINPHNNPDYSGRDQSTQKGVTEDDDDSNDDEDTKKAKAGKVINSPTAADKASPIFASALPVSPGQTLTFDNVNGNANNDINDPARYSADGNLSWVTQMIAGSENGKSDINAPINSIIAVFLSDAAPTSMGAAPALLDFATDDSRNFLTLQPQLRQTFFIGDGRRASGEVQRFVVPPGATRMYIGTMDSYEWNNNVGNFTASVHISGKVTLVD